MSLMLARRQEDLKYLTSTLLKSSNDLGWSTLFAELRSYSQREGPGLVEPHAKISITVRGSDEGLVRCKVGGSSSSARPTTGSIWLMPIGGKYDEAHIRAPKVEVVHLYIPNVVFARLTDDYNLPSVPARSIRYCCGVQDDLISQIGLSVLSEMMSPTAAGRMLVETSSLLLAARLTHAHAETELIRLPMLTPHRRLDDVRLRRVLAYIEEHLAEDISVTDLANVACLSIFHFTRAFAATMGVPPHRYVSQRRLESAKVMIATGSSLSEIAYNCQFSSQSSFTRAFRRATGMTPAEYRRTLQ